MAILKALEYSENCDPVLITSIDLLTDSKAALSACVASKKASNTIGGKQIFLNETSMIINLFWIASHLHDGNSMTDLAKSSAVNLPEIASFLPRTFKSSKDTISIQIKQEKQELRIEQM
jgi:hypothetical protein